MSACNPLFGFDISACVGGAVVGWIALVPWWGWVLLVLVVAGALYKLAGWPGVVALAAVLGYGTRVVEDNQRPAPPVRKAPVKPKPKTIFDWFNGG